MKDNEKASGKGKEEDTGDNCSISFLSNGGVWSLGAQVRSSLGREEKPLLPTPAPIHIERKREGEGMEGEGMEGGARQ